MCYMCPLCVSFQDGHMRLLTTFTLLTICLTAKGQTFQAKKNGWFRIDTLYSNNGKRQKSPSHYSYKFIDTEVKYSDAAGVGVIIQNSLPKGGGDIDGKKGYTDFTGKKYGYAMFWTRIINGTDSRLKLTINFPATLASPYSYLKLILPTDSMTPSKESLYNYGIKGLRAFLDANFNKPTMLTRTINPKEDFLFYVASLTSQFGYYTARTGLIVKGQDLFYGVRIFPDFDSPLFPCGQIVIDR